MRNELTRAWATVYRVKRSHMYIGGFNHSSIQKKAITYLYTERTIPPMFRKKNFWNTIIKSSWT